jgi:hypothetical protein
MANFKSCCHGMVRGSLENFLETFSLTSQVVILENLF